MNEYEIGNHFEIYGYQGCPETSEPDDIDHEFDADLACMEAEEDE